MKVELKNERFNFLRYFRKSSGFTLIELLVALIILGILLSLLGAFYPRIIRILQSKKAISYVEDNIEALQSLLRSQSPCQNGAPHLSAYLAHARDVFGNPFYYRVAMEDTGGNLNTCLASNICVVRHTALYVCEIENFTAVENYLRYYNNASEPLFQYFECNGTGNRLIEVTGVIVSPGANHRLETPLVVLNAGNIDGAGTPCPLSEGDCYAVLIPRRPIPESMRAYWNNVLGNSENWLRAIDDGEVAPSPELSSSYDDILRYLPLSVAKKDCPPTKIVANIDKFWVENEQICNNTSTCPLTPVRTSTSVHWIVSYAGDGLNPEAVRCVLDADGGNITFHSPNNAEHPECHNCTGDTVCELCYWDCAGRHEASVEYEGVPGGLKSLLFQVKDDTGQTILMKYAHLLVLGENSNTTDIEFNATAWRFENGSKVAVDNASAGTSDTSLDNVYTTDLVEFTWSNITSGTSCIVYFGDGETSGKIPDCRAVRSTSHQYRSPGSYQAVLYVEGRGSKGPITINVIVPGGAGNATLETAPFTIEWFRPEPESGTTSTTFNFRARITYEEGKVDPYNVRCELDYDGDGTFDETIEHNCVGEVIFDNDNDTGDTGPGFTYSQRGIYTPHLKVSYTENSAWTAERWTSVVVQVASPSEFSGTFTATAYNPDGTIAKSITVNRTSSDPTNLNAQTDPFTAPLTVKFSWEDVDGNCMVDFGDGETSGVLNCSAVTSVVHVYKTLGSYEGVVSYTARLKPLDTQASPGIRFYVNQGTGAGAGEVNEPPRIIQFKATPNDVSQATLITFKAKVCEPDSGGHFRYQLYVAGCKVGEDNTGYCEDICKGDANCGACSGEATCTCDLTKDDQGACEILTDCKIQPPYEGVYTARLVTWDDEGHTSEAIDTIDVEGATGIQYLPWAPGSGNIVAIKFINPNNETLTNYPVRVDALAIKNCIGMRFKIVTETNQAVSYCWEHLNGECDAVVSDTDWTGNIWVKVPEIPANGEVSLYAIPTDNFYAKDGSEVFDFYEDFKDNDTSFVFNDNARFEITGGKLKYLGHSGAIWDYAYVNGTDYVSGEALVSRVMVVGNGTLNSEIGLFVHKKGQSFSDATTLQNLMRLDDGDFALWKDWGSYEENIKNLIPQAGEYYELFLRYDKDSGSVLYRARGSGGGVWVLEKSYNASNSTDSLDFGFRFVDSTSYVDWVRMQKSAPEDVQYYAVCYQQGGWTPPPTEETEGCAIRVRIANLGDCDVTDYQFRLDISKSVIKQCITSSENDTQPSFIVCYGTDCGDDPEEINGYGQTTGLPYCFETSNGECTNSTSDWANQKYIWVKIPEIPAHDFVYLTLQRVDLDEPKNVKNGDEVFDFYDDFNEASLDTGKWQVYNAEEGTNYSLENGTLKLWGAWNDNPPKNIATLSTFSFPFVVEDRVRADALGDTDLYVVFNDNNENFDNNVPVRINFDTASSSPSGWYEGYSLCVNDDSHCSMSDALRDTEWHYRKHIFKNGAFESLGFGAGSIGASDIDTPLAYLSRSDTTSTTSGHLYIGGDTDSSNRHVYLDWIRVRKAACGPIVQTNPEDHAKINVYNPTCVAYQRPVLINVSALGFDQFKLCEDSNQNGRCDSGEPNVDYCYLLSDGRCTAYRYNTWTGYVYANVHLPANGEVHLAASFDTEDHGVDGTDWFKIGSVVVKGERQAYAVKVENTGSSDVSDYQVRVSLSPSDLTRISGSDYFSYFRIDEYSDASGNIGSLEHSGLSYCFEQPNGECSANASVYTNAKGDEVFDFYDDFNEGSLDTNKWENVDASLSFTSGLVFITNPKGDIRSLKTFKAPYAIDVRTNVDYEDAGITFGINPTNLVGTHWWVGPSSSSSALEDCGSYDLDDNTFSNNQHLSIPPGYSGWQIVTITVKNSTGAGDIYYNGTFLHSKQNLGGYHDGGFIGLHGWSGDERFDWVRVRKYAENVTVSSGALTTSSPVTVQNTGSEDLTGYQVKVTLTYTPNSYFYLVADTDTDPSNGYIGPVLYCYEQSNGECSATEITNTLWLKVPQIPAGGRVYIYHVSDPTLRKPVKNLNLWVKIKDISAGSANWLVFERSETNQASSGNEVFDFYDDFNEGSLDTNKWEDDFEGDISYEFTSKGTLKITGAISSSMSTQGGCGYWIYNYHDKGSQLKAKINLPENFKIEARIYYLDSNSHTNELGKVGIALVNATHNVLAFSGIEDPMGAYSYFNYHGFVFDQSKGETFGNTVDLITSIYKFGNNYCALEEGNSSTLVCNNISPENFVIAAGSCQDDGYPFVPIEIDWVRVRKYAEGIVVGSLEEKTINVDIPSDYTVKVDVSGLPTRTFSIVVKGTGQRVSYCFLQPNGECNNASQTNQIFLKLPQSVSAGSELELLFISSESSQAVGGKDIFDFYDEFKNLNDWTTSNAGVDNEKAWIQKDGYIQRMINSGTYFIEFKVTEIENNTLKVSCAGETIATLSSTGDYSFKADCGSGLLKFEGTNSDAGSIKIEYVRLRDAYVGNIEKSATAWSEYIAPIDPIVEIDGVSHEIWTKIVNPNSQDLTDYQFPIANVAWLKTHLGLSSNGTFYIKDKDGNIISYCFEQENGECNETSTDSRIWVKMSLPGGSSKWLRFIGYDFASGKPAGLTDGAGVFEFYDDFKDGDTKWDVHRYNNDLNYECVFTPDEGVIYLTKASNDKACAIFPKNKQFTSNFIADFRFKAGGGTGADGMAFVFNWDNVNTATGGALGFAPSSAGYMLKLENYKNEWDPVERYIGFAYQNSGNFIPNNSTYYATNATEDNQWHTISIGITTSRVNFVKLDGRTVLFGVPISGLSNGRIGWGASTGGATNNHVLDWIRVRKYVPGAVDPYVPIEFMTCTGASGCSSDSNYDYSVSCSVYKLAYTGDDPLTNYQVRLETPGLFDGTSNLIITRTGAFVPFCYETSNGECQKDTTGTDAIWMKYPQILQDGSGETDDSGIPQGNRFLVFKISTSGSAKAVNWAVGGKEVFEFYDDFNDGVWNDTWEAILHDASGASIQETNGYLRLDGKYTIRTKEALSLPNKVRIEGAVVAEDWNEWVGFALSATDDVNTANLHGFDDVYDFGFWGWAGDQHSTRTWVDGSVTQDDHGRYPGFFDATNGQTYLIGGAYDGEILKHYKPSTDVHISNPEIDHVREDTTYRDQQWTKIFLMVWTGAIWKYYWVRVRKYSGVEPVILTDSSTARISCYDWLLRGDYETGCTLSGSYYTCQIDPDGDVMGNVTPYSATCDMTTDGGGWTVIANENYESGTASGWNTTNTVTVCGEFGHILGGYNVIAGEENSKTFTNIPPYQTLKYSVDYIKIDSWDNEEAYIKINDYKVWSKQYTVSYGTQICGSSNPDWNEYKEHIEGELPNIGQTITFTGGSTLNQPPSDESWALDNLKLMVK